MLTVHSINDLGHPRLQPYLTFRQEARHREQGLFIAEGAKINRRLLESRIEVESLLLPEKWLEKLKSLIEARSESIDAFVAPKSELEKLMGVSMYQGVTGVGRIPAPPALSDIIQKIEGPGLIVAADGITGSDNAGTLARNGAAFGVHALLMGDTSCSAWLRKAVRTSMGTIFKIPAIDTDSLPESLKLLKSAGYKTVAAHAHTDEHRLSAVDLSCNTCLILGSEGSGIREEVLAECDEHVIVPMANQVDSLNVGSAASVFLYEAARQRGLV